MGAVPPTSSVPPVAGAPSVGQPGAGFGMPPAGTGMPMMPQQPVMFAQPMMRPPFGAAAVPGTQVSFFSVHNAMALTNKYNMFV
ncbi:Clathrin coat assembly protein AP180 [Saguinus oedipus]|uniref:Clathrin coat assembly protein AP180 n=1 Tax=Saguinus oedipus TaxID=9490 RepID=A0ABQ9VXS9_SAGOE|nr:Clathrin coat assembly protein AP180 [Saguinus oedipus]